MPWGSDPLLSIALRGTSNPLHTPSQTVGPVLNSSTREAFSEKSVDSSRALALPFGPSMMCPEICLAPEYPLPEPGTGLPQQ